MSDDKYSYNLVEGKNRHRIYAHFYNLTDIKDAVDLCKSSFDIECYAIDKVSMSHYPASANLCDETIKHRIGLLVIDNEKYVHDENVKYSSKIKIFSHTTSIRQAKYIL
mgnify:CR=1 FL=1